MSGETELRPSSWTVDTLHALMDERDRRYAERFLAQEKAVLVALEQTKTRFENVNEWRGTVTDLLANAMPRKEAEARSFATAEKINAINSRLDKIEGKGIGIGQHWAVLVAVVMIVLVVVGFFLK